jgi:hypothetical protein
MSNTDLPDARTVRINTNVLNDLIATFARPSVPVGRHLIDHELNRSRNTERTVQISDCLKYMIVHGTLLRVLIDGEPKFWLKSRLDRLDDQEAYRWETVDDRYDHLSWELYTPTSAKNSVPAAPLVATATSAQTTEKTAPPTVVAQTPVVVNHDKTVGVNTGVFAVEPANTVKNPDSLDNRILRHLQQQGKPLLVHDLVQHFVSLGFVRQVLALRVGYIVARRRAGYYRMQSALEADNTPLDSLLHRAASDLCVSVVEPLTDSGLVAVTVPITRKPKRVKTTEVVDASNSAEDLEDTDTSETAEAEDEPEQDDAEESPTLLLLDDDKQPEWSISSDGTLHAWLGNVLVLQVQGQAASTLYGFLRSTRPHLLLPVKGADNAKSND